MAAAFQVKRRMKMSLNTLNAKIARLDESYKRKRGKLVGDKTENIQKQVLHCMCCGKGSRLGQWGFVQDNWYVAPYSCNGGAYWKTSKTQVCDVLCPKCKKSNYIYNHPDRDRIVDLVDNQHISVEKIFATVWEKYGDNTPKQIHPKPST